VTLFFGHDDFLSGRQLRFALDHLALRFWHTDMEIYNRQRALSTALYADGEILAIYNAWAILSAGRAKWQNPVTNW